MIRAFNKKTLYDIKPKNWDTRIEVAKDAGAAKAGSKCFFWFQSLDFFIQDLEETEERWFYERISNLACTLTWSGIMIAVNFLIL